MVVNRLIFEDVERWAADDPAATAIRHDEDGEDRSVTYGELSAWSTRIARVLLDHGVQPGDRVAVSLPKGPADDHRLGWTHYLGRLAEAAAPAAATDPNETTDTDRS